MTSRQHGLSLIELLVAFAIMAMSLGLLYRSMGGSARSVADMALQQQAALVAESVLAMRESVPPQGWQASGASAGFQWQVQSSPYQQGPMPGTPALATVQPDVLPLHRVQLSVRWAGGSRAQQLDVVTLLPQRKPLAGEVVN